MFKIYVYSDWKNAFHWFWVNLLMINSARNNKLLTSNTSIRRLAVHNGPHGALMVEEALHGENRLLVTDELIELWVRPVHLVR